MTKAGMFADLLRRPGLDFICEAHNGLSAKIVEEAGFSGIWGSGLTISAQFGVRDNNEASWTQVLDVLEFMSDAVEIPILLDGDTGYGNFNNVQRLVRKLEQRRIAAVCLEDKLFPKSNSFIDGNKQQLADMLEFAGRIRAAKDAQSDADFSVIARVEAFIAGWGLDEAMRRSEAYHAAGADAILMHSGRSTPEEILSFLDEWDFRCPVVLVPTKYFQTPTDVFRERGVSLIIWANHILRSAITAMEATASTLYRDEGLVGVEKSVAPLGDVFRLQGAGALKEAEARYLPSTTAPTKAIVLAATRGSEFRELTEELPKAMLPVGGRTVLDTIVSSLRSNEIGQVRVVAGWRSENVRAPNIDVVVNNEHESSREVDSLTIGLSGFASGAEPLIVCYGDVLLRPHVVNSLVSGMDEHVTIVVDPSAVIGQRGSDRWAFVTTSQPYAPELFGASCELKEIAEATQHDGTVRHGAWVGMIGIPTSMQSSFLAAVAQVASRPLSGSHSGAMTEVIQQLISDGILVRVAYSAGGWADLNTLGDLVRAQDI
jgi:phosphoenolpyruvate phosphomutase